MKTITIEVTEKSHKHLEMIVAKAANMDLVLFIKLGDQWQATGCHDNQVINIASHYEYFLCLPQHKEECLHWLNGGKIQAIHFENQTPNSGVMFDSMLVDVDDEFDTYKWKVNHIFMEPHEIRIKPKHTPLNIPWAAIDERFNATAMDKNEDVWFYESTPIKNHNKWTPKIEELAVSVSGIFAIDTSSIDWENSLTKRPEAE